MDRTFKVRTTYPQLFFLLLLSGLSFYFLWIKSGVIAAIILVFLVILIERIIKSSYTITQKGVLIIYKGRFSRVIELPIPEIKTIEKCRSTNFGKFHWVEYLLITSQTKQSIALMPINEKAFLHKLEQYRTKESID